MADGKKDDIVEEDVGGVQGDNPQDAGFDDDAPPPGLKGETPEQPAPDAGEIEWAGGLVKRPPAPEN